MERAHEVSRITLTGTIMRLCVDGTDFEIDLAPQSECLANATPEQRANFEVSPTGYGIHWPDVDEDLSIDGLFGVKPPCPLSEAKT